MAALIRGMKRLFPTERHVFLLTKIDIVVESKRFVRALRRKPVRVLFPENDTGKVINPPPPHPKADHNAAEQKMARNSPAAARGQPDRSDPGNMRSETAKHVAAGKDQVDGLRFERAVPGDKRLS